VTGETVTIAEARHIVRSTLQRCLALVPDEKAERFLDELAAEGFVELVAEVRRSRLQPLEGGADG
jgi:hypothetical protein